MASDLVRVDRNLQTIRQIEGAWSLPKLPDNVALDLAGNTIMEPQALQSLLTGIEAQVDQAQRQQPLPTRDDVGAVDVLPAKPSLTVPKGRAGAGVIIAGVTGMDAPRVLDTQAVQRLKQALVNEGYLDLPANEVESSRWLPEYSYAASQRSFDMMSKEFQGEKPGSVSINQILGVVDDWLSPRGLYRAAVELDLWWDFEEIGEEFDNVEAKWRKWREDPWNVRNFVELLGGGLQTLDDLLFPVVNVALMFSGIGEVMGAGRVVFGGLRGASKVAGLYRGAKGLRFMDEAAMAADVARFKEASFLSGLVGRMGGPGKTVAKGMNQWRKMSGVVLAKKVNQQVIKAGFTGKLEQLIDSDRGGMGVSHLATHDQLAEQIETTFSNPMLDWGMDLLLFPPSIYAPGRFSKPGKAVIEKVRQGFVSMADNRELTNAWNDAVVRHLAETEGDEAVKAFNHQVSQKGLKGALRDTIFGGDDETMGTAMGFVTIMAGVDAEARTAASIILGGPLNELDTATRNAFHQARNVLRGRLRILDPDNVDDLINHFTKYGVVDTGAEPVVRFERSFEDARDFFVDNYLEAAEDAAARAGAVPDGHARFYGTRNDAGRIQWSTENPGGDPFFVDVHVDELRQSAGDGADSILRGETPLPEAFTRRYLRRAKDEPIRHYRLSEAGDVRVYRPEAIGELKALARHHNELRAGELARIMEGINPDVLSQYVYEVLPTFGDWTNFTQATGEIRHALMRGDLDAASYLPPMSPSGRIISDMPQPPQDVRQWVHDVYDMMAKYPNDPDLVKSLERSVFSPFARQVDLDHGQFTVARLDSPTKQDALSFAAGVRVNVHLLKGVRRLKNNPLYNRVFRDLAATVGKGPTREIPTLQTVRQVLAEAAGMAMPERHAKLVRRLLSEVEDAGASLDDIEALLTRRLENMDVLPNWAEDFHVPTGFADEVSDLVEKMSRKVRELQRQANFMASEVQGVPDDLLGFLGERGYKLVHGVDFHQPYDMDGILPEFADATRNQIRRSRLGDFFDRQDPEFVTRLKVRKVQDALVTELGRADAVDGIPLNLGSKVDPDNADLQAVMGDLFEILDDVTEAGRLTLARIQDARFFEKMFARASLARIPWSLDRLGSDLGYRALVARLLQKGYNRNQAQAIYRALQKSQALGFRQHGLFAIETKLRSSPNLIEGLRTLGTIQASDKFKRVARATAGAVVGGYAADAALAESEGLGRDTLAGLGARAGAMIVGGALGGTPSVGIPGVAKLANRLENSDFLRYAYIADHLANIRDYVRFSLSPIFDASRYSEAIILGQVAELPDGLRNLRINQSPTTWRRMIAKEYRAAGYDRDLATRLAQQEWGRMQDSFAAAARNYRDFDWEAIDGVGRRFSSVGILGFSPVDWMTSTYGHLVRAGVDQRKAYEAVRDIYTYGTTGRSAAELSMNFVFFPFSFTKKTVGHLSKFFSDDLTRLVVLHDMMATYQTLDEHYDLSQEWRDRLPILQRAHRLNLLAYGVGLGRFGGVNAPMFEAVGTLLPDEVWDMLPGRAEVVNAFIPQVVTVNDADDANNLWDMTRQMVPVMNDVQTMLTTLGEQGRVALSETHMTARAETRHAWEEWRGFQEMFEVQLQKIGLTWGQAVRRPEINEYIQQERTRISLKYPAWKQSLGDGIAHQQAIEMEMNERIQSPKSRADQLLGEFNNWYELLNDAMVEAGVGSVKSSPEVIPPEFYQIMRQFAQEFALEDPEFIRLYDRFFRRQLGDITFRV